MAFSTRQPPLPQRPPTVPASRTLRRRSSAQSERHVGAAGEHVHRPAIAVEAGVQYRLIVHAYRNLLGEGGAIVDLAQYFRAVVERAVADDEAIAAAGEILAV